MNRNVSIGVALAVALAGSTAAIVMQTRTSPDAPDGGVAGSSGGPKGRVAAVAASSIDGKSFPCTGSVTVTFQSTVPGDNTQLANQQDANCYAWQEFISLNWPEDASAGFGDPLDTSAVAWETYMNSQLLYQPDAASPPPFGTQPPPPSGCPSTLASAKGPHPRIRSLVMSSKFTGSFVPSDIQEAAPESGPNWLGAQNGTNLWYEELINQDEVQFIVDGGLYDATKQAARVAGGTPFQLPIGGRNGPVGAMEVKAAWMEVNDPANPRWATYKLSVADVVDPTTSKCRQTTLALVGLHVIHKTGTQNDFFWATFEHENNAPDDRDAQDGGIVDGGYDFYSPQCQPHTFPVPAECLPDGGVSPVTVGCKPNQHPPYFLRPGCPGPKPVQVTRVTPIDSDAVAVNTIVKKAIASVATDSVWQHYVLVNLIWNPNPANPVTQPLTVPTNDGGIVLPNGMLPVTPVANTVLETYAQNLTCTDCHVFATLAPTPTNLSPIWFSDFSFLVRHAQVSAANAAEKARLLRPREE